MLSKEQLLSTVLEDSFIAEYTACFLLHIPLIYVSYLRQGPEEPLSYFHSY